MPYSVSRVGEAWVIFCNGQPILAMKNRRDASHCAKRAAQLLVEWETRERNKVASGRPDETSGRGDADH